MILYNIDYRQHNCRCRAGVSNIFEKQISLLDVTMFLVAGVNPVDYKIRKGDALKFVVPKPKIPGGDLSGVVEDAPEKSKV